jgi:hypothetical protein
MMANSAPLSSSGASSDEVFTNMNPVTPTSTTTISIVTGR